MERKLMRMNDGTFYFEETEDENKFYFYRMDGNVLDGNERNAMDMYQMYTLDKMMQGDASVVMKNLEFETSEDGRYIIITAMDIGNSAANEHSKDNKKTRRLFKKLFRKKQ